MEWPKAKPARTRSRKKSVAPGSPKAGQAAAKAGQIAGNAGGTAAKAGQAAAKAGGATAAKAGGVAAKAGQTAAKAGGAAALRLAWIIRDAAVAANRRIKPVARVNQLVTYTKGHLPGRGKS